jgi:hypothetical protein
LAEAIRTSGKPDPQWSQLMAQHNAKMRSINMKGAAARHKIRMDTNREIAQMNFDSNQRQQAMRDQGVEKFNQVTRGVETFIEPNSQTQVELPFTHDKAWKLNDGTYILTDDQDFQPYRDLGVDGDLLERTP